MEIVALILAIAALAISAAALGMAMYSISSHQD